MDVNFAKYHGIGNDFIMINGLSEDISFDSKTIAMLCDRHFGIGADGLIIVRPSDVADYFMDYYNSDGSIAEMCGNGIRCFAMFIWDEGISDSYELKIETRAGIKLIRAVLENGNATGASVDMGEPILEPNKIPTTFSEERAINMPLSIDKDVFNVTCVSMGNPHCVLFIEDTNSAPVTSLGPKIEVSEYFPQKTNVEFAEVIDQSTIKLRVWERGCGETLACGTGACATLVASILNGKTERSVMVNLPGGSLSVQWDDNNHIVMSGPAVRVFVGIFSL